LFQLFRGSTGRPPHTGRLQNEYCEYAASAIYIIHVFYMNEVLMCYTPWEGGGVYTYRKLCTLSTYSTLLVARQTKTTLLAALSLHVRPSAC
jgi:hypothetical protein